MCRTAASERMRLATSPTSSAHPRSLIEVLPLEQPAHPVDDISRTLVILADVGEYRANFFQVGRWILQEKFRSLRIAEDRTRAAD